MLRILPALTLVALLGIAAVASGAADKRYWPKIDGVHKQSNTSKSVTYDGTDRSDKLLGGHGSDTLRGHRQSDVIWGDHKPSGQPTSQRDKLYGGGGTDFIYGSHGHNRIYAGAGNDAVSVHFGRGVLDCGPGRDIYHVARTRRRDWTFRNCEKVDYRSERQRGGGLKPLR